MSRHLSLVEAAGNPFHQEPAIRAARRRPRRPPLFEGYWLDLTTGERSRAARLELREAHRLWAVHRDIRKGRAS
jgi:hypothetical protein